MPLENLAESLARAARALASEDNVEHTLDKAVELAVEMIRGCDAAGVTLVRRGNALESPAYTDEMVARGDALQLELGEGPCVDAVWEQQVVISGDLASETRWPGWAARLVAESGARSMMCVQLFTSQTTLGALNLYAKSPHAFDPESDRYEAQALAAHVAVALVAAQRIENLYTALDSRTVIGQAEGILMERFDLSPQSAFEVLRRVSSHSNEKLHAVALELVRTRRLPPSGQRDG